MSSSSPPNPTTTTTTTATADFLKSVARQNPRKHLHPSIYQTFYNPQPAPAFPLPTQRQQPSNSRPHNPQPPATGGFYPFASSGRGLIPKQPNSDQNLGVGVVPSSEGFPTRPGYHYAVNRPYGSSNSDVAGQSLNQSGAVGVSGSANPKAVGQSSVAADNTLKYIRDKNGDDAFVVIRDRKVQVTEGTSLYAQCRSWLKNGFVMEKPPQYVDRVKSLPKPLPASMAEPRNEDDMEIEEKIEDVEHLSAKELLQLHVKRAKKVRARLRNQRLQRIERYKDRLALLLPPVVDQQPKTDPAF